MSAGAGAMRFEVRASDAAAVRALVAATGFFRPDEIDVAVELVETRLQQGDRSGYEFAFCERYGGLLGYACWGPIACTLGSFDLYWIAVDPACQREGIGRRLMAAAEQRMRGAGARRVYIETSSRALYDPTREFYLRCGYHEAALLPEFYAPGDGKVVYCRVLDGAD